ncbi:hypothetical protein [Bradyrhizobium iriomotense]|uniref:DUF4175 domain-containing protein n=1 Tax=Bradyrhizobium iriomotense TaxID=441950 RepID=A0ABQ6AU20_9BRAD|nr:hypothetical protein [Bradyrhizobium iriomotense]GLR84945.1 hypothetical protein GCM10007857_16550 [Bradyrhizobium iriomotense]
MMHGSPLRSRPWIRVFGAPILIAVATSIGLLAALLWGEIGKYVAWVTVGCPVPVISWAWLRRDRTAKPS